MRTKAIGEGLGGSEGHGLVVAQDVPGCAEGQLLLQLQSGAIGLVQLRGQWAAGEDGPNVAICWDSRALSKGWCPGGERGCTKASVISRKENGWEICKLPTCGLSEQLPLTCKSDWSWKSFSASS